MQELESAEKNQTWWTTDLRFLRNFSRKLFRKTKGRNPQLAGTDIANHLKTSRESKETKRMSWKYFCGELEGTSRTSRLRQALPKDPSTHQDF